jgi:hypothetical protein
MSVWEALCQAASGENKVNNVCSICKDSQAEKDQLTRVAALECAEGEVTVDNGTSDIPEQCLLHHLCFIAAMGFSHGEATDTAVH